MLILRGTPILSLLLSRYKFTTLIWPTEANVCTGAHHLNFTLQIRPRPPLNTTDITFTTLWFTWAELKSILIILNTLDLIRWLRKLVTQITWSKLLVDIRKHKCVISICSKHIRKNQNQN